MSMYGDNTPKQDMLDNINNVAADYNLTHDEVIVLLSRILADMIDIFENESTRIQRFKKES